MRANICAACLCIAAFASPTLAGTFYVDAVNGDNANSGTSWGQAWRTITHAAAHTGGSDTIEIAPGLYDRPLGEIFPIGIGTRTFRGVAGPDATIVDGSGTSALFTCGTFCKSTVEGLWLRDAGVGVEAEAVCWMDYCTSELTLRDVVLSDMGSGIDVWSWTDWYDAWFNIRLERVIVKHCGRGIYVHIECETNHPTYPPFSYGVLECRDSLICGNGNGIEGFSDADVEGVASLDMSFNGCTFADNPGAGVFNYDLWGYPASIGVSNSIFYGNGGDIGGPAGVSYSNTEHSLYPGTGNISADPLFHDPVSGDYRLRFGSPCADTGNPAVTSGLDVAGIPRPLDGDLDALDRTDMGAHELAPLALLGEPAIGTKVHLEFWGPPGGVATIFYHWGLPYPPIQKPQGKWYLGVAFAKTTFPDASTAPGPPFLYPLRIPNDPGLVGESLSLQALSTSGHVSPPAALTNPLVLAFVP